MARKAATLGELQELHSLIAKSLNKRITQDMEDEIPTDAATQSQYDKSAFLRYACRVMWLWRNCAYGFSYNVFSKPLDETISEVVKGVKGGKWSRFTQRKSSWQFKADYPVRDWFKITINIGWKEHTGFPKVMYADRPIGTDSLN